MKKNWQKHIPSSQILAAMKSDHSLQGSLISLNEDNQHHDRKPPVIDNQNNRRTQHVKYSSRKYQHDDHKHGDRHIQR